MDDNLKTYYIGEIARELGLSQRAIRYYEELGFIKPCRSEGGFRTYRARDLDVIRTIVQFKELGMALEDIRSLFLAGLESPGADKVRHIRETLIARRGEIELRLKSCEDGIRQIDRVLKILSEYNSCDHPADESCEACLSRHGGDQICPLITPLLTTEQEAKE